MVGDVISVYWDDELGEMKYQIGEGCGIDQVLAQWHANIYGLGEIFDTKLVKLALQSIYENNFIPYLGEFFNPCRVFGLNDEGGLIICSWPSESQKPLIPVPYSQEVMTGFEYAAAIHMLQEGLIDEGLAVVSAIRDRFDGEKRNPWNEFECGSNYARSMASYALLLAYSGFRFDMVQGMVGFNPLVADARSFRCFWALDRGWGTVSITPEMTKICVLEGSLQVKRVQLPKLSAGDVDVSLEGVTLNQKHIDADIVFDDVVTIKAGESLLVSVTK
jgi:hypothetical protein